MIIKGCKNCRRRHIKCNFNDGASACEKCAELGRQCEWEPRFRFKEVRHIYQQDSNGRSRFNFTWDRQQTWMNPPSSLDFVIEDDNCPSAEWEPSTTHGRSGGNPTEQPSRLQQHLAHYDAAPTTPWTTTNTGSRKAPIVESFLGPGSSQYSQYSGASLPDLTIGLEESPISAGAAPPLSSPQAPSVLSPIAYPESFIRSQAGQRTSFSQAAHRRGSLAPREASLLRYYVEKIAPWLDVCDSMSHFGTEVPRRALREPMVMYALLTMAARLKSMLSNTTDVEASSYYGHCLELLIPALSLPESTYDDNVLVTVIILRLYEELESQTDPKFHLLGSNRLLNSISRFSSSGGLGEAASWQFLRQAIYVSLVQKEPWQLRLDHYEQSKVFERTDDASCANAMIYLFAKILRLISQPEGQSIDPQEWSSLEARVERWRAQQPCSFEPLTYRGADVDAGQPFSEVWMLSPAAVVGMQYYHAAIILLNIHRPMAHTLSKFEEAKLRRNAEVDTISRLADIIGLAKCHENVENANFTVCHLLYCYGYCLSHPLQRTEAVSFLRHIESVMGWQTLLIIETLERQWGDLDDLNLQGQHQRDTATGQGD